MDDNMTNSHSSGKQIDTRSEEVSSKAGAYTETSGSWSELVVPVFAISAVISIWLPEILDHYTLSTIIYSGMLGIPIVLLALSLLVQNFRRKINFHRPKKLSGLLPKNSRDLLLVSLLTAALIYFFDLIGYLAGFALYLLIIGRMFYKRSWLVLLLVVLGTVAFIHFIFVIEFQMQLPTGLLAKMI